MIRNHPCNPWLIRLIVHTLIYGLCGGVLIVVLKLVEFRFRQTQRQAAYTSRPDREREGADSEMIFSHKKAQKAQKN